MCSTCEGVHIIDFTFHYLIMSWLSCIRPVRMVLNGKKLKIGKWLSCISTDFSCLTILCKSKTAFFFRVFLPRLVHFHSSSTAFNEAFVVRCRNPHRLNCFPRIARPGPPPPREKTRVAAVANGPVDVPQTALAQGWFLNRVSQP